MIYYEQLETPIGTLTVAGNGEALVELRFAQGRGPAGAEPGWRHGHASLQAPLEQLREYFARQRQVFDVPLAPTGTVFQRGVLDALREIPYGLTRSYAEIAHELGRPRAVRAVGAANGRNPLPVFIPCHRVIGSDGRLAGFAGGLEAKRWLLALEGVQLPV